jgi:hypothetical protein
MAQSIVDIYKFFGREKAIQYGFSSTASAPFGPPPGIGSVLQSELPGPALLYHSRHYDPWSIAIVDQVLWRFPALKSHEPQWSDKSDDDDIIALLLRPGDAQAILSKDCVEQTNTDESHLLVTLVRSALLWWEPLFVREAIESVFVISVHTIGPSIHDSDVLTHRGSCAMK